MFRAKMVMPGFLAKKLLRKPYLVWCRGSGVYLPWRFKRAGLGLALRNADAVIALTKDMKREIQKICNREIIVIPNGIDLERFQNLSREEARNKLQIKADDKIIIFVGSLRPVKGVKYLIKAMKIVRQKEPNARLILIGNGEEKQDLVKLTGDLNLGNLITFVGKIPNEKVPEYMAASNVFVLPSLSEGFPLVSLEAMACGLPIVVSRVCGLPEIVEDGKNGFLVESGNPEQIAEKVLLLLEDDELRERMSRNNKEKVKDYTWEGVIGRLERIYEAIGR